MQLPRAEWQQHSGQNRRPGDSVGGVSEHEQISSAVRVAGNIWAVQSLVPSPTWYLQCPDETQEARPTCATSTLQGGLHSSPVHPEIHKGKRRERQPDGRQWHRAGLAPSLQPCPPVGPHENVLEQDLLPQLGSHNAGGSQKQEGLRCRTPSGQGQHGRDPWATTGHIPQTDTAQLLADFRQEQNLHRGHRGQSQHL